MNRLFIALLSVAGSLLSLPAIAQDGAFTIPPARVEIAAAELRDMAPIVDIPGSVVSQNDSRMAAEVSGVLISLARVGDTVSAGDTIARIDARYLQVGVKRARANVARLRSEFDYRERQLARTEELEQKQSASATLVDEARARRDQAKHELATAGAELERAELDLERTKIRAPFAGHITQRLASVGEFIDIGEDVIRLVDTRNKEITLSAPIALVSHIRPGQPLKVRNNGSELVHPVRTVVPVGDAISRMVEIRLSADNSDWLVGSPVQVSLPSAKPKTLVAVPRDALVERGGQSLIYKVQDDGTAKQITANVEMIVGLWVGVTDGIEADDKVIIRGAERLSDGQALDIVEGSN